MKTTMLVLGIVTGRKSTAGICTHMGVISSSHTTCLTVLPEVSTAVSFAIFVSPFSLSHNKQSPIGTKPANYVSRHSISDNRPSLT